MRLTKKRRMLRKPKTFRIKSSKKSKRHQNIKRRGNKKIGGVGNEEPTIPDMPVQKKKTYKKAPKKVMVRSFRVMWSLDYDGTLTKAQLGKGKRIAKREIKSMIENNISTSVSVKVASVSDFVVEVKLTYKNDADYDDLGTFSDIKSLAASIDEDGNFPIKVCENRLLSGQIV